MPQFSPAKVREKPLSISELGCGVGDSVAKGSQEKTQDWEVELSFSSQLVPNCSFSGGLYSLRDSLSSTADHLFLLRGGSTQVPPLPCNSNTRFLFPVLHPFSLLGSSGLELSGEEARGLCPFGDSPCLGLKADANLPYPLGQGWGHFPGELPLKSPGSGCGA